MKSSCFHRACAMVTALLLLLGQGPLSVLATEGQVIVGGSQDAALGIIGGADGPTVIFVSGNWWTLLLGVAAVIAALVLAVVIIRKRKK